MMIPHGNRGLTFVELFVVLALLALVSSLAVPAYRSAIFAVERARMQSQMKMLMNDESLYERDHGTFYPELPHFGSRALAWATFAHDEPMFLAGQNVTLPAGNRKYTFSVFRLESHFHEPIIFACAHPFLANDLDGDDWPDLWVKIGQGPAQLYIDDLTDTVKAPRGE
ncbi:MAG: hypothetical protein Q9Q40_11255 [Acidobacteriota bacterium]|nr:hypothetical protein [Acidobacteriota bacterium]MDQ7086958.1 hypothetical protein [Acidobacteriota bacterium]